MDKIPYLKMVLLLKEEMNYSDMNMPVIFNSNCIDVLDEISLINVLRTKFRCSLKQLDFCSDIVSFLKFLIHTNSELDDDAMIMIEFFSSSHVMIYEIDKLTNDMILKGDFKNAI